MSTKQYSRAVNAIFQKCLDENHLPRFFTVLFAITVIYPLIFIILVSFKNNQEFYTNIFGFPALWRFENYARAWINGRIGTYALNSIIVTSSTVVGTVLFTALGGYALSKMHIPKANVFITVLMTLNFVPGVAIYIPLYMQMIDMKLSGFPMDVDFAISDMAHSF